MAFPQQFVWGAAAASYQIEGAAYEDGKGLSVWDVFSHRPGAVYNGDTGDIACDHYHRYQEDVDLMREIGLHAYRMSISWPRILPDGTGRVNAAGLDFYDRLIDALLAANITPYITLFHWDYPWELYCRGGWLNRDSADWFAEYTGVVAGKLGDRVKHWMPLNEPVVFVVVGHEEGRHAPGDKYGKRQILRMIHHALLAHGKAVQVLRDRVPGAQIGTANVGQIAIPASNADIDAARQHMFDPRNLWSHTWWLDPIFKGQYPEIPAEYMPDMPLIPNGDMATIAQPLDFLGFNAYSAARVHTGVNGDPEPMDAYIGEPVTLTHWLMRPETLYWAARFLHERYGKPLIVTENGLSNPDWVSVDGQVHDPQRIDFLTRYLRELHRAGEDGVELAGYFQWSIMDNFEWAQGYRHRFGMVHIDYRTGERTVKDSARWYAEVIQSNGAVLLE